MCGIVGYIGKRRVVPILLEGLKRLEYRGYDSAGLVYIDNDANLKRHRFEGKLANLEEHMEALNVDSRIGLGHTRWATHGAPSQANAHPHYDCSGDLVVVHNGIIENYHTLRDELTARGHKFNSETDTEVLAHLIEENLEDDLAVAVRKSLKKVVGSYALAVLWAKQPDRLVAARNHSPLVLGVQEKGGSFLASDIPALLPYTREIVFLEDREMAILTADSWQVMDLDNGDPLDKEVHTINWNAAMAEKTGYKHFMLKEIFEQPLAILNTFRGRLAPETCQVSLPEAELDSNYLQSIKRISLVACGTSWHAALVAKYWLEKWTGVPVEVDIASEFRYRTLLLYESVLVVPISQSGETADTLAGMPRSATGQNNNATNVAQFPVVQLDAAQFCVTAVQENPAPEGIANRLRLLKNFLEHEVLVAALFGHDRIPRDPFGLLLDRSALHVGELGSAGADHDDLPIAHEDHVLRVHQDRGDVGGDERLALTDPDDERWPLASGHQQFGVVGVECHHGVDAGQLRKYLAESGGEVVRPVLERLFDQMGDHLGVGLGHKGVPLGLEVALEHEVVLDDPVVDHDESPTTVAVRMRVFLGRSPMRRPTRVAESVGAGQRVAHDHLF